MITNRHNLALEMEILKWFLLIAFAIVMALALATALAAADPDKAVLMPPAQLPEDMARLAKPLQDAGPRPYFPEDEPTLDLPPPVLAARVCGKDGSGEPMAARRTRGRWTGGSSPSFR
jgi:hypothetical protein